MIIVIEHSVSLDGISSAIYNSLFQFIITRKCDEYEVVVYGDSKSFDYYKKAFKRSCLSKNVKVTFIVRSSIGKNKLVDYCNVKSCLLDAGVYFYISHNLKFIPLLVSDKYKGLKLARDMYDVCLHTRKGVLVGLTAFSLTDLYVTKLLQRSVKIAFNLIRYELSFLYQEPLDDSFLLSIDEKDRLLKVSFEKYKLSLSDFLSKSKNISESTKRYVDVRLSYIMKFDSMIKIYDSDTNKADVYFYYAFYLYLICKNLFDSKKYSICVSTSIRILETYLTGYLIGASRAKPESTKIKLYKYNSRKSKCEWVGSSGFGHVWEVFLDEFPLSLDATLISKLELVKDLRNKSIYGHGYLPLTASSAKLSMDVVLSVISEIEKYTSGKAIFFNMKGNWVHFNKDIQKEILLDNFAIS